MDSSGSSCAVRLYEKKNSSWNCLIETNGIVGKNGVSDNCHEGDYCTPKGIFSLGFAFGIQPMNNLNIEYRQININCYWIDDPLSQLYNQWVESNNITWNSAEHLIEYSDAYKYSVVINYNMNPVQAYKGSAFFIHCMTGTYTAGCVAVPEKDMLKILEWLDSSKNPIIMIN
nr:L,D-transpeptidase family protein [Ruminococcus sp.]